MLLLWFGFTVVLRLLIKGVSLAGSQPLAPRRSPPTSMTAIIAVPMWFSTALPSIMGQTPVTESSTSQHLVFWKYNRKELQVRYIACTLFSICVFLTANGWNERVHPHLVCRYTVDTQTAYGELPTLIFRHRLRQCQQLQDQGLDRSVESTASAAHPPWCGTGTSSCCCSQCRLELLLAF